MLLIQILKKAALSLLVTCELAPFFNLSIRGMYYFTKVPVRSLESHLYLTAAGAAKLRRRL